MNKQNSINYFIDNCEALGDKIALIWKDKEITYSFLHSRIKYWEEGLASISSHQIIGIESDFSPETIAILFTLLKKGVVIVPLDITHSDKNADKIELAEIDILIKIQEEEIALIVPDNIKSEKNELYKNIFECNVPGLILFTSGSSGKPKAALHDFSKLLNKFLVKRKSLLTINFLLFDHWGGLNTLFHILSSDGTVVFLENRNPDYICGLIEKYKVELLPTSPTFLNMLLISRAYERHSLESLKIISYGAEPMPESVLQRLNRVFPGVKLQQTYGLIELGVLRSQSKENSSLWVKIGGEGYQTRVRDGILQILSDSAMIGYLNAPSPFTEDGWFITGDSVEVNGDYFKILGRKSELINIGGEKVFPQEIESVLLQIPNIIDVLVYSEENNLVGKIVCAKIYYSGDVPKNNFLQEIKKFCNSNLEPFKVPRKFIFSNESFENDRFKKQRSNTNN
jgi:acyl-coenzyme A synthetase/AMP-(fatty) acid ligase